MARQGAQKALENCTSVARSPTACAASGADPSAPEGLPVLADCDEPGDLPEPGRLAAEAIAEARPWPWCPGWAGWESSSRAAS